MKKTISLMLSVLLIFSLCMPAAAVRDLDPPLYERCGYSSMEELLADWEITEEEYYVRVEEEFFFENWHYDPATGDMNPAIWEYEGYSSKEEYLAENDMTPEIYDELVMAYRVSYDWHYNETTGDMDPPVWKAYGYESMNALIKDWDITEAEYYELVGYERVSQEQADWSDEQWDEYYDEQRQEEKAAMGLVYDINVMFRGTPFVFTDAVPEIVNDRVMVPLRAVMENMGAQVNYDDASRTAVITRGETQLTFVLGSSSFDIAENGQSKKVTLDSVPYIKNSRVFVPIRFVAESLGYDVFWSEEYRTGVYFDREAIVSELNENYSIINSAMSMGSGLDMSKNYKGNVNMDLKITAYDKAAGNPSFTVGLDAVVVENQNSAKMTMEFDIASIIDLVEAIAKENGEDVDAPEIKEIIELIKIINDGSVDMIIDLNKGVYYMNGSLFAALGKESGLDIDSNTWIEMDLSQLTGVDYSEIMGMAMDLAGKFTIGDFIYTIATTVDTEYVYAYSSMLQLSGFADLVADSEFKKSGSSYKYNLDVADLIGMDGVFKLGATVTMKDGAASRVKMALDIRADDFVADIDMDTTATEAKLSGLIDIEDAAKVQFTVTSTVAVTDEVIPTAPPAGAKIIPFEDIADIA